MKTAIIAALSFGLFTGCAAKTQPVRELSPYEVGEHTARLVGPEMLNAHRIWNDEHYPDAPNQIVGLGRGHYGPAWVEDPARYLARSKGSGFSSTSGVYAEFDANANRVVDPDEAKRIDRCAKDVALDRLSESF